MSAKRGRIGLRAGFYTEFFDWGGGGVLVTQRGVSLYTPHGGIW